MGSASLALLAPTNLLMDHKRARFARKRNIASSQRLCLSLIVSDVPPIRIPSAEAIFSKTASAIWGTRVPMVHHVMHVWQAHTKLRTARRLAGHARLESIRQRQDRLLKLPA